MGKHRSSVRRAYATRRKYSPCRGLMTAKCRNRSGCKMALGKKRSFCRRSRSARHRSKARRSKARRSKAHTRRSRAVGGGGGGAPAHLYTPEMVAIRKANARKAAERKAADTPEKRAARLAKLGLEEPGRAVE